MTFQEDSEGPASLVEIFLKAKELERKGKDVIHFDAGEPDYGPPAKVVRETVNAIKLGKSRYTESSGILEARMAIMENIQRNLGVEIRANRILVVPGGRLGLYYAFTTLPSKSKVGIVSPDWPAYRDLASFLGYRIEYFQSSLNNNWEIDLEAIEKSDCNALVINYPNNPTGKILDMKSFEELIQIARRRHITIISDEVYSSFVYDDSKPFKSVLETADLDYLLVTSLSKSYSMTGYRAAYVVSDEKTVSRMSKTNGLLMTSTPEFVQHSVIAAMSCDEYVRRKVILLRKRKDLAVRELRKKLGAQLYPPDGSLYLFPKISAPSGRFDSEKFALKLLESKYVSVTPGTSFGKNYGEHFRMTLLQDEKRIAEGIERMAQLLK